MGKPKKSILVLAGIVIVCAIAVPAIIGELPSEGFVTTNTTSQVTVLGNHATYLITIENTGNVTDVYSISVINVDNASVAVLNQTEISLDGGQSGNVTLNVTDTEIIGPYCVMVNATSQADADVTDEVETLTAVVEDEAA